MWPRLVPNDEHEGVFRSPLRTADACRLLSLVFEHAAGSWAMARDKSQARPATFTSHSERIGAYVVHTRAALAARLGASCDAAAVLACVRALVIYAPDTALHTSHESVLRAHIEPWLASELEACVYAYAILALWPQPPIDAVPRLLPHAPKAPYAWDVIGPVIELALEVPWGLRRRLGRRPIGALCLGRHRHVQRQGARGPVGTAASPLAPDVLLDPLPRPRARIDPEASPGCICRGVQYTYDAAAAGRAGRGLPCMARLCGHHAH